MIKTAIWNGKNKQLVRLAKIEEIEKLTAKLTRTPLFLTFAGAQAKLEKQVIERGIAEPWQITTVQTYERIGGHLGGAYLRRLVKARDKALEGMFVWPHSFSNFCRFYTSDKKKVPHLGFARSNIFREEMTVFLDEDFQCDPFNVLDIDICGVFSPQTARDIASLFSAKKIASKSVLFFTHQKGRDACGGRLFPFIRDFINENNCEAFSEFLAEIKKPESQNKAERNTQQKRAYELFRYNFVPSYFALIGALHGYQVIPKWLMEYRDPNPDTGVGNFMFQWAFEINQVSEPAKHVYASLLKSLILPSMMRDRTYTYKRLA